MIAIPESLLETPPSSPVFEDALFEVIDGERVEAAPMGFLSNYTANIMSQAIAAYARLHDLGFCVVECLFQLPDPVKRSRRPDIAFVSWNLWPKTAPFPENDAALQVVPEFLAEVVSPSDLIDEVMEKVHEYFRAGAVQVCLVFPKLATVQVFDGPHSSRWLTRNDAFENIPGLPGFRLPLSEVFVKPAAN